MEEDTPTKDLELQTKRAEGDALKAKVMQSLEKTIKQNQQKMTSSQAQALQSLLQKYETDSDSLNIYNSKVAGVEGYGTSNYPASLVGTNPNLWEFKGNNVVVPKMEEDVPNVPQEGTEEFEQADAQVKKHARIRWLMDQAKKDITKKYEEDKAKLEKAHKTQTEKFDASTITLRKTTENNEENKILDDLKEIRDKYTAAFNEQVGNAEAEDAQFLSKMNERKPQIAPTITLTEIEGNVGTSNNYIYNNAAECVPRIPHEKANIFWGGKWWSKEIQNFFLPTPESHVRTFVGRCIHKKDEDKNHKKPFTCLSAKAIASLPEMKQVTPKGTVPRTVGCVRINPLDDD